MDPYSGPSKTRFITYNNHEREDRSDRENETKDLAEDLAEELLHLRNENEALREKLRDLKVQEESVRGGQSFHVTSVPRELSKAYELKGRTLGPPDGVQSSSQGLDTDPQRFRQHFTQHIEDVRESEGATEDLLGSLHAQDDRSATPVAETDTTKATQRESGKTDTQLRGEIKRLLHALELLKRENHELRAQNDVLNSVRLSLSTELAAAKNEHLEQQDTIRNLRDSLSSLVGTGWHSDRQAQAGSEGFHGSLAVCGSRQSTPRAPLRTNHVPNCSTPQRIESFSESFQLYFTPPSDGFDYDYVAGSGSQDRPRQELVGQCSSVLEGDVPLSDAVEYEDGSQSRQTSIPGIQEDTVEESYEIIQALDLSRSGPSLKRKRASLSGGSNKSQRVMEYSGLVEETPLDSSTPCQKALATESMLTCGSTSCDAEEPGIVSGPSSLRTGSGSPSCSGRDSPSQLPAALDGQPDDQPEVVANEDEVLSVVDTIDPRSTPSPAVDLATEGLSQRVPNPEEAEADVSTGVSRATASDNSSPRTSSDRTDCSEDVATHKVHVSRGRALDSVCSRESLPEVHTEHDLHCSEETTIHRPDAELQARADKQRGRRRALRTRKEPQQTVLSASRDKITESERRQTCSRRSTEGSGNRHPGQASSFSGSDSEDGGVHSPVHADTDEQLKKDIQASYTRFGLETRLLFRYGRGGFSPHAIDMSSNWKRRSQLNQSSWRRLASVAEEIAACFPTNAGSQPKPKEVGLIRRLCRTERADPDFPTLRSIAHSLHADRDLSRDESHLAEFECYSVLMISQQKDQSEVS
ncbi:hypothetical protein LTR28_005053 [Elasticomyces elasticus]|nr:hypothetical protein LTR28_005053 [Elasticomyces elasticus]